MQHPETDSVPRRRLRRCRPLVPDRLSYPELFPASCRYLSMPEQPQLEGERIAADLERVMAAWPSDTTVISREASQRFSWAALGPLYRAEFECCRREYLR